jgi:CheY-like chemotaxis protein
MPAPRILVVDDDPIFCAIARETLSVIPCETTACEDGDAALALLTVQPFDLVITDINMPKRDGIELIFEMRRRWPETRLIAISGGTRAAGPDLFLRTAELLGAATMRKPIPPKALLGLVERTLAGSPAHSQAKPAVS